jgi:hypothetical protein
MAAVGVSCLIMRVCAMQCTRPQCAGTPAPASGTYTMYAAAETTYGRQTEHAGALPHTPVSLLDHAAAATLLVLCGRRLLLLLHTLLPACGAQAHEADSG